jgi:chromosomal replication initiation ATPase DnaA
MKDFILTITATCDSITLDELKVLEDELKHRIACSDIKVSIASHNPNCCIALHHVLYACAKIFGVEQESLADRNKSLQISFARHAYCHLASMCGYTFSQIGAKIARNHSTVFASQKASQNLIFSNNILYKQLFEAAKTLLEQQCRELPREHDKAADA